MICACHFRQLDKRSAVIDNNENFKAINKAFPHIGQRLRFLWGYPEFSTFMDDLLQEKKGVQRQGFPGDILMALISLGQDHDTEFPGKAAKKKDIWGL
jgi:hypothetical protein